MPDSPVVSESVNEVGSVTRWVFGIIALALLVAAFLNTDSVIEIPLFFAGVGLGTLAGAADDPE